MIPFGLQMMMRIVAGDYKGDGEYIIYDLSSIHSIRFNPVYVQLINQTLLDFKFGCRLQELMFQIFQWYCQLQEI